MPPAHCCPAGSFSSCFFTCSFFFFFQFCRCCALSSRITPTTPYSRQKRCWPVQQGNTRYLFIFFMFLHVFVFLFLSVLPRRLTGVAWNIPAAQMCQLLCSVRSRCRRTLRRPSAPIWYKRRVSHVILMIVPFKHSTLTSDVCCCGRKVHVTLPTDP